LKSKSFHNDVRRDKKKTGAYGDGARSSHAGARCTRRPAAVKCREIAGRHTAGRGVASCQPRATAGRGPRLCGGRVPQWRLRHVPGLPFSRTRGQSSGRQDGEILGTRGGVCVPAVAVRRALPARCECGGGGWRYQETSLAAAPAGHVLQAWAAEQVVRHGGHAAPRASWRRRHGHGRPKS